MVTNLHTYSHIKGLLKFTVKNALLLTQILGTSSVHEPQLMTGANKVHKKFQSLTFLSLARSVLTGPICLFITKPSSSKLKNLTLFLASCGL